MELTVTTNGKPLKARTYVLHADRDKEAARDRTDADGIARYRIPTGKYRIKIRPDGIDAPDRFIEDVTVTAGETTTREIDFGSGSVELTVTTNGKPLKARTYVLHADRDKEAARDRTDADGIARYRIPTGKYRIKIRPDGIDAPDRFIEDVTVTAGETARESLDIPSGKVILTVTHQGKPLDARTYIQYAESHAEAARDRTNDSGLASYAVPPGEYRIKIRPYGIDAADHYITDVVVAAGKTTRPTFDFAEREDSQ